jgi:hypothetical protein
MRHFIVRWLSLVALRRESSGGDRAGRIDPSSDMGRSARQPAAFRSVELRTQGTPCGEAKALAGKRILVAEAPSLPLQSCTLRCSCYYKPHDDRRDPEPRRRIDAGMSGTFYAGPERRSGHDRRSRNYSAEDNYYDYMRRRE